MNSNATRSVGPAETLLLRPPLILTAALAVGCIAGKSASGSGAHGILPIVISIAFVSVISFILGIFLYYEGRLKPYLSVLILIPIFSIVGSLRSFYFDAETVLERELDAKSEAIVTGKISDLSFREKNIAVTLKDTSVRTDSKYYGKQDTGGLILYIPYDKMGYGEISGYDMIPYAGRLLEKYFSQSGIVAKGKLYPFEPPGNSGQFDSESYNRNRGLSASMSVDVFGSFYMHRGLREEMIKAKTLLIRGAFAAFPREDAGLVAGLLTGDKGLMDGDMKELFSDTGIGHIMSISGLHVSLILLTMFGIILRSTRRLRLSAYLTIFISYFYLIFTGSTLSAKRAVAMLCIALIGRSFGALYDGLSGLGIAAAVLIIYNPDYLSDTSFILSFSAACGVFLASETARGLSVTSKTSKAVFVCFLTQLFIAPVLMINYGEVAVLAVLLNLTLVPLCGVIVVSGLASSFLFLAGTELSEYALGRVFSTVGRYAAGPAYYVIELYRRVCTFCSSLKFNSVVTGAPPMYSVLIFYSIVLICCTLAIHYKQIKPLCGLAVLLLLTFSFGDPKLYVNFLDVGQGKCIYLESDDYCCLIDGGSSDVKDVWDYRIEPYLKNRGIVYLDDVFITHTDEDHVNGLEKMFEEGEYIYGRVIMSSLPEKELNAHDIAVMSAGDSFWAGNEIAVNILNPKDDMLSEQRNEESLVILFRREGFSLLATGDSTSVNEAVYSDGLTELLGGRALSVLDVPHHGSRYSTSEALLLASEPSIAVVSAGKGNMYGHPHKEVRERLEHVGSVTYETARTGMVTIRVRNDETTSVEHYIE